MEIRSEDDAEFLPVPMEAATLRRLKRFAADTGMSEVEAAAVLLRDVLADDEMWNAAAWEIRPAKLDG